MACYHPIVAWRARSGMVNGKWPLVFNKRDGYVDKEVKLPCGHCIGCRLEYSRQWAIRCMHEAAMYQANSFITLTYANDNVNDNGVTSLVKDDWCLYMKRFRAMLWERHRTRVRFFQCGEYGELLNRPHHHACIFGWDFPDKYLWSNRKCKLYRSPMLEELWPYGFSSVGDLTFESAAYTARYIVKKITGDGADQHYDGRVPEYVTMSRRPGIGRAWYDRYSQDVRSIDKIVVRNGLTCRPPRYYDSIYDRCFPTAMAAVKRKRLSTVREEDYSRLQCKENLQYHSVKDLKRNYEINER